MNRFSVIYLLRKQYHHIYSATYTEAEAVLRQLSTQKGRTPIGIYDAKTELFYWEPTRQSRYNEAGIEEQGKLGDQIIGIAQRLRQRGDEWRSQSNSISQLLSINKV
ncbi:hypothetical protein [Spirosoma endbachense]|uniref:Uncharacterized protein n=1 Tax=Spirosoma endbachense TaxID=2666025 RepID=A0A6P1VSJ7_9BACT|nr:hypothetical protein [Spirosoma endbachense]QHV94950.1 hypothetical protein GJR95_07915 [Spirosoma endbachense]